MKKLIKKEELNEANEKAIKRIMESRPVLVDIQPAIKIIPKMRKRLILHSGPPIIYEKMCGPQKGGIWGALIYEGLANDLDEAKKLAETGQITFDSAHDHHCLGPMAGITSASMPVYVVKNETFGNMNYISLSPFSFGNAFLNEELLQAKWVRDSLAPVLKEIVKLAGKIDLKTILAKGLYMGDEEHNRFDACNALLTQEIMQYLVQTDFSKEDLIGVSKYFRQYVWLFGCLMMVACKNMMEPAMGVKNSTIVTVMARNGVEAGIKVADSGERWFTGPAQFFDTAIFFPPFSSSDANRDIGDSAISETRGLGGAAFAASFPATLSVGGSANDAIKQTRDFYQITFAKDNVFKIPSLDFEGVPLGIDIRKVIETGFTPIINTGIAHKEPGYSRIGSGRARIPMECFKKALIEFGEKHGF